MLGLTGVGARPLSSLPLIYVAGPYTAPDPLINTERALAVGKRLMDEAVGWPVVPHLSHYWDQLTPMPYETWLALDFALLARCDALLRIAGESSGADREMAEATRLGIPMFHEFDALRDWVLL